MTNYKKSLLAALLCAASVTFAGCDKDNGPEKPVYVPEEISTAAVNLSENGTANCYIVKPGSVASFDVAHKGNSATELTGSAASVKLVWQDAKGLVKSLFFNPETKTAYAEIAESKGNALVAVCDEAGTILWSWHLWICDYDPEKTLFTTEANASGTQWTFMDRNIGATDMNRGSFDNFGMLYQWGRKDPFPGAAGFTIQNEDYSYVADGEKELYGIDGKVLFKIKDLADYHGTIENSIQFPTTFYAMTYKATGEVDEYGEPEYVCDYITKDWVDVSDDDYWGGVSMKKTIYDPCPVGYKVPVSDTDGNTPYAWMKFTDMTWDAENHGALIYDQWFPCTGTRVYASGGLDYPEANPYAGVWFGTAAVRSATSTSPEMYGQYMAIMKSKRTFKVMKDARSQGMCVRCVKE